MTPQRVLAGASPAAGRESLADHERRLGPRPTATDLIGILDASGLLGRGGAGFPVARKWAAVAERGDGRAVILANGAEGEPLSSKDKAIMSARPHLVLDGAELAAEAVGADRIVVYVGEGHRAARMAIEAAATERMAVSRGGRSQIPIDLVTAPHTYIAGEESAAVHYLNVGDARPTAIPPRPFERGVGGRATLVQNVESLAQVALIARHGDGWYRELGRGPDAWQRARDRRWRGRSCGRDRDRLRDDHRRAGRLGRGRPTASVRCCSAGTSGAGSGPTRRGICRWTRRCSDRGAARSAAESCTTSSPEPAGSMRRPASSTTWPASPPRSAGRASSACEPSPMRRPAWRRRARRTTTTSRTSSGGRGSWPAAARASIPMARPHWSRAPYASSPTSSRVTREREPVSRWIDRDGPPDVGGADGGRACRRSDRLRRTRHLRRAASRSASTSMTGAIRSSRPNPSRPHFWTMPGERSRCARSWPCDCGRSRRRRRASRLGPGAHGSAQRRPFAASAVRLDPRGCPHD